MPPTLTRRLAYAALLGAGLSVAYVVSLTLFQHKIIYFPRRYDSAQHYYHRRQQMGGLIPLSYETSQGKQVAFYAPPQSPSPSSSSHVWLLFGGNAAVALDWADVIYAWSAAHPHQNTHWLAIDYPGYGNCSGLVSPSTVLESSDAAVTVLCQHLGITRQDLASSWHIGVLGHSLGAAAAMQWVNHVTPKPTSTTSSSSSSSIVTSPPHPHLPVHSVILISPFTSMLEMARALIGRIPGLHFLLKHNYDNTGSLLGWYDKLSSLSQSSQLTWNCDVHIVHGTYDEIVPVDMGKALYTLLADKPHIQGVSVTYSEVASDHNMIIGHAQREIFEAIDQAQSKPHSRL